MQQNAKIAHKASIAQVQELVMTTLSVQLVTIAQQVQMHQLHVSLVLIIQLLTHIIQITVFSAHQASIVLPKEQMHLEVLVT